MPLDTPTKRKRVTGTLRRRLQCAMETSVHGEEILQDDVEQSEAERNEEETVQEVQGELYQEERNYDEDEERQEEDSVQGVTTMNDSEAGQDEERQKDPIQGVTDENTATEPSETHVFVSYFNCRNLC